jgi:repressor LexA
VKTLKEKRRKSVFKKDQILLEFLQMFISSNGYAPTYTEMMQGIGEKSKNGIARKLDRLEREGYIRRTSGKSRALVVESKD